MIKSLKEPYITCFIHSLKKKLQKFTLQFRFRQKHSPAHASIHWAEVIKKQLHDGSYGSGIFADFQKAFDTVVTMCLKK